MVYNATGHHSVPHALSTILSQVFGEGPEYTDNNCRAAAPSHQTQSSSTLFSGLTMHEHNFRISNVQSSHRRFSVKKELMMFSVTLISCQ